MGWWSEDILGGDGPLDTIAEIEDILEIEDLYPLDAVEEKSKVAQAIEEKTEQLVELMDKSDHIYSEVLAVVIMSMGAKMDHRIKTAALQAAQSENPVQDGWGNPEARQTVLDEFCDLVEKYDNKPVQIKHASLFDKMEQFFKDK